ncbi:MAG TPA: Glu/Leu/Phe/Val dehydrogenase dimerization domain-containing protein [Albidovulum sp.]|uniref:Glu/Leu/Phe/Val family dehydrogenase n=1 Tax=Albidovulum sp. TaxID=1872424 RepID=UPI002BA06BBB|nr:Glu/Leu/Phe/Val dehydrogenase dimerization domain-containing protein [Albidovulum sp.]
MQIAAIATQTHEEVYRVTDAASGLRGFIAVHSTTLGPAAGGLRMRTYRDEAEALEDVLRLSRGMSLKNAAADLPLGGGKAVILGDPATEKTPELLRAMGRAVESLKGRYWTAEDMGMSTDDMGILAEETGFVAGLAGGAFASGDPSPVTAKGVFHAIRLSAARRLGSADLAGRRVALQGLGHVGSALAVLLHGAGAKLIVSDIDAARTARAAESLGAEVVPGEMIHAVEAEIFAPCAIGAILNPRSIPELRASVVAGAANNQLATPEDGRALHAKGILYAPDFVANGGGIINVAAEILRTADRGPWVEAKLAALDATLGAIYDTARRENRAPSDVAEAVAEARIRAEAA